MKRILLPLIAIVFCLSVNGQEPESFEYQVLVRNVAGEAVILQPVSIQFSILKGSVSGEVVYSETQNATTSQSGLISLSIGKGSEKSGDIKSIEWTSDSYFLKVETDTAGGSNFSEVSTTQLLIVPGFINPKRTKKSSAAIEEDELVITRKYVGSFIDYRHTGLETYEGPNLIWIKTSLGSIYGKLSAYGKNCGFSTGQSLYVRRILYTPGGISGYWIYQVENDKSIYYRLTDFQHDKKVFIDTWFK
jgi:hypothetical protein